jgi:hypothetical protein
MTKTKDSTFFENKLIDFIAEPDPLFPMMQWLTEQLMEIEVSKKANAQKNIHSADRKTYRCGPRLLRFDTRFGIEHIRASQVGKFSTGLDDMVQEFRMGPIEEDGLKDSLQFYSSFDSFIWSNLSSKLRTWLDTKHVHTIQFEFINKKNLDEVLLYSK